MIKMVSTSYASGAKVCISSVRIVYISRKTSCRKVNIGSYIYALSLLQLTSHGNSQKAENFPQENGNQPAAQHKHTLDSPSRILCMRRLEDLVNSKD